MEKTVESAIDIEALSDSELAAYFADFSRCGIRSYNGMIELLRCQKSPNPLQPTASGTVMNMEVLSDWLLGRAAALTGVSDIFRELTKRLARYVEDITILRKALESARIEKNSTLSTMELKLGILRQVEDITTCQLLRTKRCYDTSATTETVRRVTIIATEHELLTRFRDEVLKEKYRRKKVRRKPDKIWLDVLAKWSDGVAGRTEEVNDGGQDN